ncbi:MAG: hypothetical protein LIO53_09380 [Oscillospiraceae bacterium]|nr:hypothetical protein [Oscillospiraceae bacterium]
MKRKHKLLIKSLIIGIICGALAAAVVCVLCTMYISTMTLDEELISLTSNMRALFMSVIGAVAFFAAAKIIMGREEKRMEREWQEYNRKTSSSYDSDIIGVNIIGLMDDTQVKKFTTIFGEKVEAGDDHGTVYMIFNLLFLISLFIAVAVSIVLVLMFLSLK